MAAMRWGWVTALPLMLGVVGCGTGAGSDTGTPTASVDSFVAVEGPVAAVSSVDEVEPAVARIVATGAYVDPDEGEQTATWSGTGFFIDSGGRLVTNNHVATGAAILEVWVTGENEPRTARVLGQDECSDLAVLEVDGEGFTSVGFYTDSFDVGLEVYSAGYPLGDPEYTLTGGIVAKRNADGATNWTSVEEVVQHDARINPGSSGGPLVAVDGRVVGINYAGNNQTDESFAITAIDAIPIIEQLAAGQDRESLGINAQAMLFEDGSDGVFVQSVETGSPADQAGIEAGDLILTIEGVSAASDGTMAGYCSILRSKGSESPLKVALYRPSTGEMLEGRINAGEQVQVTGRATGIAGGTDGGSTDGGSTEGSVVIDHEGGRLRIPATMAGWEIRRITLAGQEMLVSVADDDTKISTGLVGTPSPFDLDGVLFVYPSQSTRHFWSLDARFPLDFGFFRSDGSLVTVYRSTAPCLAEPCPRYPAIAQYVVATPGGALDEVAEGAVLVP